MNAPTCETSSIPCAAPTTAKVAPFSQEWVTLTQQEHIELMMQARYWKSLRERMSGRITPCLALKAFGSEDSEVLQMEVKAYRRLIHRQRYRCTCRCGVFPGIVTPALPERLIERGKFSISVWTSVLLDKFLYGRPSARLLSDLEDHGLIMSAGSLTGGLRTIALLFAPLCKVWLDKLRSEPH